MRSTESGVKHFPGPRGAAARRSVRRRKRDIFDGWQAGAVLVLIAASAVLLAVPRAVEPDETPVPAIDERALRGVMQRDDELARGAVEEALDVDVRAVGRELRAYNLAAETGAEIEVGQARTRLVRATAQALLLGSEGLLALRAFQAVRFAAELARFAETGVESDELVELGGDVLRMLDRYGWCEQRGAERRLLLDERAARVFFKKRWNDLVGVRGAPYELSLDEERVRYAFLLRHPPVERRTVPIADERLRERDSRRRAEEQDRVVLGLVGKLASLDDAFPADLARGVVLYRMRELGPATEAFRRHLEVSPDGPYALRAQNYLKACLDRVAGEGP